MKKNPQQETSAGAPLSRRAVLGVLGAAAAAPFVGRLPGQAVLSRAARTKLPACVVRPQQTEGPYFVDTKLNRSDIRSDPSDDSARAGVPLRLVFQVSRVDDDMCAPLVGAVVDVWQCDALGIYSGVKDMNDFFDTREQQFLRGHQVTDEYGAARFTTIYPGWYQGRTVHIHFKIRTDPASQQGYAFTSQLYFEDAQTDQLLAHPAYAGNEQPRIKNERDGIFRDGGDHLMLALTEDEDGYTGTFDVGLQLS